MPKDFRTYEPDIMSRSPPRRGRPALTYAGNGVDHAVGARSALGTRDPTPNPLPHVVRLSHRNKLGTTGVVGDDGVRARHRAVPSRLPIGGRQHRDQPGPIFVWKDTQVIITASETRVELSARDLFSHPYTDQPAARGDQFDNRRISRVNLFREPGAPVTTGLPAGH